MLQIFSQIHDGRITGISCTDDVIVTCSTDRNIKIWIPDKSPMSKKKGREKKALLQVGQYFGFSAFTCVTMATDDVIICGDVRGDVFQIKMKESGLKVKLANPQLLCSSTRNHDN